MAMASTCLSQQDLPKDYLAPSFHKGRRDALRALMPPRSVAVIFAYPTRVFSKDVNYPYHQNPDLYYFSGYMEPDAVLLIFKEPQRSPGGGQYQDLFFVQKRDPRAEQWTGRRMGVEKVKSELGFDNVFNGSEFRGYPIDLSSFDHILFSGIPDDVHDDPADSADLFDLLQAFKIKAALPSDYDGQVYTILSVLADRATVAMLPQVREWLRVRMANNEKLRDNQLATELLNCKDSSDVAGFRKKIREFKWNSALYDHLVASLREIKTPEEMALMRKTVSISAIAHAEVMKAIQPGMSEAEIAGFAGIHT